MSQQFFEGMQNASKTFLYNNWKKKKKKNGSHIK